MTTETNTDSAQGGAQGQQDVTGQAAGQGKVDGQAASAAKGGDEAVQFSAEQQAAVDRVVAERLKRAQEKWTADQAAKAAADTDAAEAKRLEDEKKFEELARKHGDKAAELDGKLQSATVNLERATTLINGLLESKKAALPEPMVKLLEGKDIFDQLEIVDAYLAAQPAGGQGQQRSATKPTPGAQTAGADDYWQQAIKRQQKQATENDPYAAIMKR